MSNTKHLAAELKQEAVNTKRMLERIPEDKLSWKPHEKSTALGRLAYHIAELPNWIIRAIEADGFDLAESGKPVVPETVKQIMEEYEELWPKAVALLETTSDEFLDTPWKLKRGGQIMWEAPRRVMIRNFGLNHIIHHRAQLGVYFRLLDVPLPPTYGPTADER